MDIILRIWLNLEHTITKYIQHSYSVNDVILMVADALSLLYINYLIISDKDLSKHCTTLTNTETTCTCMYMLHKVNKVRSVYSSYVCFMSSSTFLWSPSPIVKHAFYKKDIHKMHWNIAVTLALFLDTRLISTSTHREYNNKLFINVFCTKSRLINASPLGMHMITSCRYMYMLCYCQLQFKIHV